MFPAVAKDMDWCGEKIKEIWTDIRSKSWEKERLDESPRVEAGEQVQYRHPHHGEVLTAWQIIKKLRQSRGQMSMDIRRAVLSCHPDQAGASCKEISEWAREQLGKKREAFLYRNGQEAWRHSPHPDNTSNGATDYVHRIRNT